MASTHMTISARVANRTLWGTSLNESHTLEILPGTGLHVFKYKGRTIWLRRWTQEATTRGYDKVITVPERVSLSYWGRNRDLAVDFVRMALKRLDQSDNNLTSIFTVHRWGYWWEKASQVKPRSIDSVILDRNLTAELLEDARKFFASEQEYRRLGIPWRRGYLLHGPPGCGKTSIVTALAGELGLSICVLALAGRNMDDETLRERVSDAPAKSILLLEDVDAVFSQRELQARASGADQGQHISFSGLLNAIDGVASQEGRLLFMSTNHIDKLDEALYRPGRCDVVKELQYASSDQIRAMFRWFYSTPVEDAGSIRTSGDTRCGAERDKPLMPPHPSPLRRQLSNEFRLAVPEGKLSMAALQGHLMLYRDNPQRAIDNVAKLLQQQGRVRQSASLVRRWLLRLGLDQHWPCFRRAKLFAVSDIMGLSEEDFASLGVHPKDHARRMQRMLAGREDITSQFAFIEPSQSEAVFLQFFGRNSSSKDVSRLALSFRSAIPPATVSRAQVMKVCAASEGDPLRAIQLLKTVVATSMDYRVGEERDISDFDESSMTTYQGNIDDIASWGLRSTGDSGAAAEPTTDATSILAAFDHLGVDHDQCARTSCAEVGLWTVGQLRLQQSRLKEFGLTTLGDRLSVCELLEGRCEPSLNWSSNLLATAIPTMLRAIYPHASAHRLRNIQVAAAEVARYATVGQLRSALHLHQQVDATGFTCRDLGGARILDDWTMPQASVGSSAAQVLGPAALRWEEVEDWPLERLLARLGLHGRHRAFLEAGILSSRHLFHCPTSAVYGLADTHGERLLLQGVVSRTAAALRQLAMVASEREARHCWDTVFHDVAGVDLHRARFLERLPMGVVTKAHLFAYLWGCRAGTSEGPASAASSTQLHAMVDTCR